MSHATTNYTSFIASDFFVSYCSISIWFILEYIINCIGKDLQALIYLVKILFLFFFHFLLFCVIIFMSTILVNKYE